VLLLVLLSLHVPLRIRWALSQPYFEGVAREALSTEDFFAENRQIGLYDISQIHREGDAVIFDESTGLGFDDAGFAYLPGGPAAELETANFEAPEYVPLGGPWYAWTASW
jgi:hypothetical protein